MTLEARSALGGFAGLARVVGGLGSQGAETELIDRADIGCLLLSTSVEPRLYLAAIEAIAGVVPPVGPGPVGTRGLRQAIWMTPRSWILLCPLGDEEEILWSFADGFPERDVHAFRYSDQLCWLELCGAGAEDLLRAGSFLSLDGSGLATGWAKRGLVAGITPIIYREEECRWLLGVERSNARYLVDWLTAAAQQKDAVGWSR
jgi:heterotetrameric sarcosine oxidase gamma subunit